MQKLQQFYCNEIIVQYELTLYFVEVLYINIHDTKLIYVLLKLCIVFQYFLQVEKH